MGSEIELTPFKDVVSAVQAGRSVVIVDDRDRENEGDLMVAAEKVSAENINFMVREGKGLICLSLTEERLKELRIPLQVTENSAPLGTNFTVSIDHRSVVSRGVTAQGRATTILAAVDDSSSASDFVMPGYVFPLSAHPGGVLCRNGQTEGSVDLARIAGLKPAGVICEIMDKGGQMLRGKALGDYCAKHQLPVTSVAAIAAYRLQNEISLREVARCEIKEFTGLGFPRAVVERAQSLGVVIQVIVYVDDADGKEQLAFVVGSPSDGCLARIHSECLTGDVFESARCDCGQQFEAALCAMVESGSGVLVYLHQEGRGIGLANKLRAYELQDKGRDTVDANIELGFAADLRDYRAGSQILSLLGLRAVRVLTNNPDKIRSIEGSGISVLERRPLLPSVGPLAKAYLETKKHRLGHIL